MWSRPGILAGVLYGLVAIVNAEDVYRNQENKEARADIEEFNKLLDQVDPPSLHAALHDYSPKKFKHGMFKEDRTAVEAIHKEEPSLASTIVAIAKRQVLHKRQDSPSNGTASATSQDAGNPPPTSPVVGSTTDAGQPSSPVVGSTTDAGQPPSNPSVATPSPVSPVEGSSSENSDTPTTTAGGGVLPPETTTSTSTPPNESSGGGSSPTTSPGGTSPAAVTTSSQGGALPSLTAGEVITTTNAEGVTIISTVGGGYVTLSQSSGGSSSPTSRSVATTRSSQRTSRTSTVLQTTTLPDGKQSTVTAVTVVPNSGAAASTPSGSAGAGEGTGTQGGNPALQTGVAGKMGGMGWEIVCLLGGAVGVAMMM
ncbi:MAG: hypothetical protein Q9201_004778 [Fulgogasparrea decipioides]